MKAGGAWQRDRTIRGRLSLEQEQRSAKKKKR
jgi:hypothetical protein